MALTSPPTAVAPFDLGYLSAGITAGATTITVSPIVKTVNGVNVKQGFDTTSGLAVISQGDYFERISFEGSSVNATTKVTTLTGVTRGLSVNSTTTSFSGGTGRIWRKGANITVVADASYFQSAAFKAVANTWTALQTFSSGVTLTGTTAVLTLNTLTSTQRDALTPAEGMMIKNSTTNTIQMYIGGAWVNTGTDATPNASDNVAGKVDIATATEIGAGTAVDATSGAINVIPVSQTTKTSSGESDENKIPVLQANGALHINHIATGTPDGTKFVRDDGVLAAIMPVGVMLQWLTDTAPSLWLLCYGQAVSRTTYSSLFSVIGTTFGSGDGSTTFNVPDMRGRFPLGQDDMGGSSANRVTATQADTIGSSSGAETKNLAHTHTVTGSSSITAPNGSGFYVLASTSNTTSSSGSASQDIMPPYITLNYIIFANA